MRTLHIGVLDKKATYLSRDGDIVCGNSDYVIEFAFDAEWAAHEEKIARFIWNGHYQDVKFTGTSCAVPIVTHTTELRVGVYAGELSTTTSATIGCQKSILCDSSSQGGTVIINGGGGNGLPLVTTDDDDKIPVVKDGKWAFDYIENITKTYTPIKITRFSDDAGVVEYGDTVTEVTLSWALNKAAKMLTLDGEQIDKSLTSKKLSGLSINRDHNKLGQLVATDARGNTDTASCAVEFANGVYYGAAAEPTEYNSAFILGLTKEVQYNPISAFTVTAGEGQYIYFALPVRLKKVTLTTSGYNSFTLVSTITFTNAFGYTEDYYVYKSENTNLGYKAVSVSAYIPPSTYVPPSTGGGTSDGSGTVVSGDTTYYGAVAEPSAYNDAFFDSLTKVQQSGKLTSFTVSADLGEYIYYASPKRLGMCQFTLGMFTGGFELADIVKADNGKGGTEDYYIFKSEFDGLGLSTLTVS